MEILPEVVQRLFPVDKEHRIRTMEKPVIIESACPGWQVGGKRYPAVPCSVEDQAKEIVDSIKAGAIATHVHPRNPRTCMAEINAKLLMQVYDRVFDEVGDFVTLQHTWAITETGSIDFVPDTEELLEVGRGNKYCQGSVVLPVGFGGETGNVHTEEAVQEGVKYLEKHRVKPIYQLYDTYTHWHFRHFFEEGVSTWKPYVLNLHLGKHSSHTIHQDPESYLQLIANYGMVQKTTPESIVGVYPGGRNWMPVLALGLMLGSQLVRVGIEDQYWVWPHRDEIIKKNSDVVKMAVDLANLFGRRVVTDPNEARQILGMELTSKP